MSWPSRLTAAEKKQIADRYRAGDPVQDIAQAFNVHHSYPTLLARRLGIPTRSGLTNIRYPEEKKDEL